MRKLCPCCCPLKSTVSSTSIDRVSNISKRSSVADGPKIIIIGAGAAGLACAMKLMEYGIQNLAILEGESRVGGRIYTIPFAENVVDLGAQWVHGERDNVVYDFVKHLNVFNTTGDVYMSFQCIRSNGEVVPDDMIQTLKDLLTDIFINKRDKMAEYDGSFGEFLKKEFFESVENTNKFDEMDKEIIEEFFENFKKIESSESSVTLNEMSARGFLEYWDCDGDYMLNWKNKDYQELLRVLTHSKRPDHIIGVLESKLLLNKNVTLIEWERDDGTVRVICENVDEAIVADNVVITVSLGVLKKFGSTMFKPPLPPPKLNAIQSIGFGDIFKVFIEFPYTFWPSDWTGFKTLWRKKDIEKLARTNKTWIQEIYGFYLVNNQPRVLEAWAVGPSVIEIEKLTINELQLNMMYILRRFLKRWRVPDPVSLLPTKWSSNKNFCGAYSFRTLKMETAATGASVLAQPLNTILTVPLVNIESDGSYIGSESEIVDELLTIKPTVLFAGEATSTHFFSTVHGAVETGWREAKRLAGYYDFKG